MSDRRVLLLALLLALTLLVVLVPDPARAQTLAEWRAQRDEQAALAVQAGAAFNGRFDRRTDHDRTLVAGGMTFAFASDELDAADSAAIRDGIEAGIVTLRERHGDGAVGLLDGVRWTIDLRRPDRLRREYFALSVPGQSQYQYGLARPVRAEETLQLLLSFVGARLVATTKSLNAYAGWSALRPDGRMVDEMLAETARRIATSWSGTARRCAAGAVDSCSILIAPFDPSSGPARYYDPVDLRAVVAAARLPALGDSAYFAGRKRCLDGDDATCARIAPSIDVPDPFNPMVRGTALMHAIELGGRDAVGRAREKADAPPLEALAYIAGVSPDSLVASWHARVHRALDEQRGAPEAPLLLASLGWGALFLLVARRRRYM